MKTTNNQRPTSNIEKRDRSAILGERGCGEAQPQRENARNNLVSCGEAAAGRNDTAALRVKMRIADYWMLP